MKRRILLVDDEVAILLTLKAVLEANGFDVDTAASGREGRSKLRNHEYHMVITDMRMESDAAGAEVISAARNASYHPAVALLTSFPIAEEDWEMLGADKMLIKPTHTRILLQQIEKLLAAHEANLAIWSTPAPAPAATTELAKSKPAAKKAVAKKSAAKKKLSAPIRKKTVAKKAVASKARAKPASKAAKR
jgi:DNA-binding response OmpR family regulator